MKSVRPIMVPEQMVEAQSAKANWKTQWASKATPVSRRRYRFFGIDVLEEEPLVDRAAGDIGWIVPADKPVSSAEHERIAEGIVE